MKKQIIGKNLCSFFEGHLRCSDIYMLLKKQRVIIYGSHFNYILYTLILSLTGYNIISCSSQ